MLTLATTQAVVAIARPSLILTVVIVPDALLLPLGKGLVVGEVVNIGAGSYSPEHLIHLGLRGSTSAYRVLRVLLDTARHGGVARAAVHRGRLRQERGALRRAMRSTGAGGVRPTRRATGREQPPKQGRAQEHRGRQVFHTAQARAVSFRDATTGPRTGGWPLALLIW